MMTAISICAVLLVIVCTTVAQNGLVSVPEQTSFNDQSALDVKANLQSKQYQDFIRTLYHLDKSNLARVENLFANSDKASQRPATLQQGHRADDQPTYADYIKSQPNNNYFGISLDSRRYKRQGAILRPSFVYRIFQERTLRREEERVRRRMAMANRRRTSPQSVYRPSNQSPYK